MNDCTTCKHLASVPDLAKATTTYSCRRYPPVIVGGPVVVGENQVQMVADAGFPNIGTPAKTSCGEWAPGLQ